MATELRSLAGLFLRLGATSFGGPAAHVAMMEDEVVRRRGWLAREAFLDLVSAVHLIPGPNSSELAMHVGWRRARWRGLLVAGSCFILPAMTIVWLLAWAYVTYGTLPALQGVLAGVKPVVFAIVVQALWGFARTALKSAMTLAIGVTASVALVMGVHELVVLFVAGSISYVDARVTRGGDPLRAPMIAPFAVPFAGLGVPALVAASAPALGGLALVMLKAGAFLFGSGYVLIAFLRTDLVTRLGWLSESQLLDAIAVGQMTPGPVFTTATFVGYLLQGHAGALVATLAIFLPGFVLVAFTAPLLARLRDRPLLRGTLDGVNVASLALMASACVPLARDAMVDGAAAVLFAVALVLLVRWRLNSAWMILGGAGVGLFLR